MTVQQGDNTRSALQPSTAPSPLAQVHDLLVSLLHWWPYGPHEQTPSILLCGPTSNGKSHLVRRVAQSANETAPPQLDSRPELMAHERRRRVISVTPRLAAAVATQNIKNGCTGLRRLLRRTVQEACVAALREESVPNSTASSSPAQLAVLLVLDHMECYLTHDASYVSGAAGVDASPAGAAAVNGFSSSPVNGAAHANLNTQYPALMADLYTVLRSAPPLFSQAECATLHLSTLVYVSLFTGEVDDVVPVVRQRYVDYALSLPTPTESERRAFFKPHVELSQNALPAEAKEGMPFGKLPTLLVEALVLRTGGVSYGGLQEILLLALDHLEACAADSPCCDAHTAGAAAQCILHTYQSSGSVTALEYRHSAGFVDVQVTRWDDIAGMSNVKTTLRRLVTDPIHHRAAYRQHQVRPSTGVLLHGPPGTGKTMLAKAMATELNASFVYMDLPVLVQSEVGESERRLQAYFDVARERSPSLVFMDEVQAAFGLRYGDPSKGGDGRAGVTPATATTSHDARLVSHLLRLLDAAQQDEDHFVLFVGATNVVHLLDPLLLRAGRLDTLLEVPLPDAAARDSLVRRVVYGEWASWFTHEEDDTGKGAARSAGVEQTPPAAMVQEALVREFVLLSDGFSGAQVRNFLSVFGLQLARTVSRGDDAQEEAAGMLEADGYPYVSDASTRYEAVQRHQRLQKAIGAFLTDRSSGEVLSLPARALLQSSHAKSLL